MGVSQQIDLPLPCTGQDREVAKETKADPCYRILPRVSYTPIKYVHVTLYMRVFVMVDV